MSSDEDSPNSLWLKWTKEWLDTARERNSKGVTTYRHAYNSLKACPIAFTHPSELQQLKGWGQGLCGRLAELLRKHCDENGLPMPEHPSKSRSRTLNESGGEPSETGPAKKTRKAKEYVPAYKSGAYALIMALSTLDEQAQVGLSKADLIDIAQPHCNASFKVGEDAASFYTAWNSMKTLLQKELVYERGRPTKRYALTDEGWEVAERVKAAAAARENDFEVAPPQQPVATATGSTTVDEDMEDAPPPAAQPQSQYRDLVSEGQVVGDDASLPTFTPIRLPPGSFQVHLVLDVREIRTKKDRDYMKDQLTQKGVTPIMRSLALGDAIWVAKCTDPTLLNRAGVEGEEGNEIVLDYIAERKRLDDLISSVKDGRFHEQKFRLRRSGLRNVIYIVEDFSLDTLNSSRYEEMVQSAMASTQVVNGYFLKRTQKMDDTVTYLARLTKLLKSQYESRTMKVIPTNVLTAQNYLPLLAHLRQEKEMNAAASAGLSRSEKSFYISYPAFASLASKSDMITLRDVFLKMLMCTKGITGEKAMEIQKRWKTPLEFVKAYEECGPGEVGRKRKIELVSSQMANLVGRKKVTKAFSQKLAEVWGDV